jgi:hypothetical protein
MMVLDNNKFPIQSDDIWYSNEKRMNNIWKIFSMDDKGKLDIYENKIRFVGGKYKLNINNINKIFITRPTRNYGAHIISGFISFICIWYLFLIYFSSIEYFLTFFLLIIILYPISLFFTRSDWIGIVYKDHGEMIKAFFTDGSLPEASVLRKKSYSKDSESLFEKFLLIKINDDD